MFPKAFQTLKLQDLGSGGFDGFSAQLTNEYQLRFVSMQIQLLAIRGL